MDTTLKYFSSASYRSIYPALSDLMELQAKKEKAQGELNSILKILIVTFSSFFVLNMVLNYFFPEINFNNLLGLPSIAIAAILLVKWFFLTMR